MKVVKEIVDSILEKGPVKTVYFVGCGGSLVGFFPAKYFLNCEAKEIRTGYMNSNEFVHTTPKEVNESCVVIVASQRGNTPETVEACKVARKLGASTIGLTFEVPSPLSEAAEYVIHYEFGDDSAVENQKSSYAMKLALEFLNRIEGYAHYEDMIAALTKLNGIIDRAKTELVPYAIKYAWEFKDDKVIYTMGSGSAWGSAHQEAEITDKNTAFLMMKSTGRTRELDDRALAFMHKFNDRIMVIDPKDYGMDELGELSEYLDAFFHTNVIRVFNNLLADVRNHPLSVRRYMWKFAY